MVPRPIPVRDTATPTYSRVHMITVSIMALGASYFVFLASSLMVEMKSKPIMAKNKTVDPNKVPLHPCS